MNNYQKPAVPLLLTGSLLVFGGAILKLESNPGASGLLLAALACFGLGVFFVIKSIWTPGASNPPAVLEQEGYSGYGEELELRERHKESEHLYREEDLV